MRAGPKPARETSPTARRSLREASLKAGITLNYLLFFFGATTVLAAATFAASRDFLRRHALRWRCFNDLRLSPRPMVASPRRCVIN
jgi:hypothetical protein